VPRPRATVYDLPRSLRSRHSIMTLQRSLFEWARCMRHNVLHLRRFRIGYRRDQWTCRFGDNELRFPYYPYLAFQDIEGYLPDPRFIPAPGQTVVDVGGCYGEYALFASRLVGSAGRVIMVEPDAYNLKRAREMFAMNGSPSNIQVFQGALSDADGVAAFRTGRGPESALESPGSRPARETAEAEMDPGLVQVEVITLATLAKRFGLERLDIVKMDVEGAELDVIRGAAQLPDAFKPRYAIASYHIVNGRQTATVLPELFSRLHYECTTGNPAHLTTWAWPQAASL
jgi:FkbM family methyltransferase